MLRPYLKSRRTWGALLGASSFLFLVFSPPLAGLGGKAQNAGAVAALMACFWIGEVVPIYAAALFPIVLFPLLGILDTKAAAAPYGDRIVFLMMGGFMIAAAMRKWGLHRRISLHIIKRLGRSPGGIILGFMAAAALLSMWMSNSATAVMMMPIAVSVSWRAQGADGPDGLEPSAFSTSLMLAIAYSAGVGGVATLVGTPPNAIFAGQVQALFPEAREIFFADWIKLGLPVSLCLFVLVWFTLNKVFFRLKPEDVNFDPAVLEEELKGMGPLSRGESAVLFCFALAAILWMTRGLWGEAAEDAGILVHDSTIAMLAALLLFMIPVDLKKREFALDWEAAARIPWGVLVLFGGGFALAKGLQTSGFAEWVGANLHGLSGLHPLVAILAVCLMMTFLTEVTSNTSTTTIMMPVMAYTAAALNMHPFLLMLPATISASCAFMLPAATPPNAIVFGSGLIRLPQMAKVGLVLNLLGAVVVALLVYWLGGWALGEDLSAFPSWAAPR